ncbi:helix-turn-helix domain-containing protein [Ruegeria sp. ANG10]|uniref:winged helix-turn-helix transcriptional regulator n=1 Tax=Ruegeria sp. ANG10 TaxID=3042467 RepID=UPI003451E67A
MSYDLELDTPIEACPVEFAVGMIGGKWKPILLFHLMPGAKRFSELQRLVPHASDRMLTRSLRELEADELVHREVFPEVPVRVEYSLTTDGKALYPILAEMSKWGEKRLSA